eukprot:jgi/Antlo1/1016/496
MRRERATSSGSRTMFSAKCTEYTRRPLGWKERHALAPPRTDTAMTTRGSKLQTMGHNMRLQSRCNKTGQSAFRYSCDSA